MIKLLINKFLGTNEAEIAEKEWQLGYINGVADRLFPGLIPLSETKHNKDKSYNYTEGYAWARSSALAVSLPE